MPNNRALPNNRVVWQYRGFCLSMKVTPRDFIDNGVNFVSDLVAHYWGSYYLITHRTHSVAFTCEVVEYMMRAGNTVYRAAQYFCSRDYNCGFIQRRNVLAIEKWWHNAGNDLVDLLWDEKIELRLQRMNRRGDEDTHFLLLTTSVCWLMLMSELKTIDRGELFRHSLKVAFSAYAGLWISQHLLMKHLFIVRLTYLFMVNSFVTVHHSSWTYRLTRAREISSQHLRTAAVPR